MTRCFIPRASGDLFADLPPPRDAESDQSGTRVAQPAEVYELLGVRDDVDELLAVRSVE